MILIKILFVKTSLTPGASLNLTATIMKKKSFDNVSIGIFKQINYHNNKPSGLVTFRNLMKHLFH